MPSCPSMVFEWRTHPTTLLILYLGRTMHHKNEEIPLISIGSQRTRGRAPAVVATRGLLEVGAG